MPPAEGGPTAKTAQVAQSEEPFSLIPAKFTLFPGFPRELPPVEAHEKLERIIENLDKQHDAVKKNMLFLIERRSDDLVRKAKGELAALDGPEPPPQDGAQQRNELRNMIARARVPMDQNARAGAYEVRDDTFAEDPKALVSPDGDVEMGNMLPRTQTTIRADLTHELRDLAMWGASEMEAYDEHARKAAMEYKRALERRTNTSMSTPGLSSAVPPRGILSNRHVESPVDREAMRKTSFEPYDGGARRGNK